MENYMQPLQSGHWGQTCQNLSQENSRVTSTLAKYNETNMTATSTSMCIVSTGSNTPFDSIMFSEKLYNFLKSLQQAIHLMQSKGLEQDPRYHDLMVLWNFYSGQQKHRLIFTPGQVLQLRAQMECYSLLRSNKPLPCRLLKQIGLIPATRAVMQGKPEASRIHIPASNDVDIESILRKWQYSYFIRRPPPVLQISPLVLQQERENLIAANVANEMTYLHNMRKNVPESMKSKVSIRLSSLKLLKFQKQVRSEVLTSMKKDTSVETAIPPVLSPISKPLLPNIKPMKPVKSMPKLGRKKFIHAALQHCKEFKKFHRDKSAKLQRLTRAVMVHHAKVEQVHKKEQDRLAKERMKHLLAKDEEGYRRLIASTKNKRLSFLLQKSDEYISEMSKMISHHKTSIEHQQQLGYLEQISECGPSSSVIYSENVYTADNLSDQVDNSKGCKETISPQSSGVSSKCAPHPFERKSAMDEQHTYYSLAHCVTEQVSGQANMMINGILKDYQVKGLEWLVSLHNNNLNGILADEMGLGKTIQVIALLCHLMEKKDIHGPFLIIVPLSVLTGWLAEFRKWAPSIQLLSYKGPKDERKVLKSKVKGIDFNVMLTTYDLAMKDKNLLSKVNWCYIIVDEGHRIKNRQCKLSQVLMANFTAQHRLLLTGTPLQNNLSELWSLLNFLLPSIFNSSVTFEQWFNAPFATAGQQVELNEEETILVINCLHKVLRPFLLRRLKKEVATDLPEKLEFVIKCEMSGLQKTLYKQFEDKGMLLLNQFKTTKGCGFALRNTLMQLRKLCNHPFLFQNVEKTYCDHFPVRSVADGSDLCRVSGKFELLDRVLPKMKIANHRVLLFCQMTKLMTILEDYLGWRGFQYLRLDGSTKPENRADLLSMFNSDKSHFIFLLSTRAGGLGLNLQSADTVILFDSDWNPHQDLQAQDRAHRIGQKNEVKVLRLISVNTVEERILAAARCKLDMDEKVIQAGMFDQKSTVVEREQFLQKLLQPDELRNENVVSTNDEINHIISRSQFEFELFQNMDDERIKNNTGIQLMLEDELPKSLLQDPEMLCLGKEIKKQQGGSSRQTKAVDYSDFFTSEDWLEEMGEDINDEEVHKPLKRRKSNKGKSQKTSKKCAKRKKCT